MQEIVPLELEIKSSERKKAMEHPPKLFDLTLLQVECNRKFAFSADTTLKIIQSLYEKKLTTYPRVDTNFLPNDIYPKVPGILKGLKPYATLVDPVINGSKIRKSPKVFNDKKITDHHAIIPTGVFSYDMTPDEKRVYDLVARRFIAVFYPDCEIANTTVMAQVGIHEFKATGKQIIDPGLGGSCSRRHRTSRVMRTCCPCTRREKRVRTPRSCRKRRRSRPNITRKPIC